ncbi:hypothetical protein SAMN05878482_1174 [Peribacillus simplex]|uniref:Uncharacterized protein n=1 Tax=Peribacillus simplex TaxID=1478 RepID=A0A9X8WNI9_9BACI|nr:hypothetical protein SAMN05878482_1174 [Peribacillus simplex]
MVDLDIETQIDELKSLLETIIQSHHYNFQYSFKMQYIDGFNT